MQNNKKINTHHGEESTQHVGFVKENRLWLRAILAWHKGIRCQCLRSVGFYTHTGGSGLLNVKHPEQLLEGILYAGRFTSLKLPRRISLVSSMSLLLSQPMHLTHTVKKA